MLRNILGGVGILAVAGLVASALSSEGTGAPPSAPRTSASAATGAAVQPTGSRASAAIVAQPTGPGKIGSYFDVQDGSGDIYQVTLVEVVDPGKSADQFVTLQHGNRLVGIVFKITAVNGSPQARTPTTTAPSSVAMGGSTRQISTASSDTPTSRSAWST